MHVRTCLSSYDYLRNFPAGYGFAEKYSLIFYQALVMCGILIGSIHIQQRSMIPLPVSFYLFQLEKSGDTHACC